MIHQRHGRHVSLNVSQIVSSIIKYSGENIKRPNILGFDRENKAIIFCNNGTYFEYLFDPDKNSVKEVASSNLTELRNSSD